ncbi:ParB/RepB/Spo0J family partition protein [Phenylobacterium aquaticum]|uniref:ParB/RepB/Spo0J family partition protein n=1 Tax=Phenylobacterium aquaticum TaxID=1763816 RepID=UPI001F5E1016|nr:ParB/RepB/Spo0J family partition protein [Phenylobacterium aquaticum]MCI3130958.1 ParB/RepB/Spo0J family partition protein [Phenylobacterium aquaticum]
MDALDETAPQPEAPTRMAIGVLAGRENRMAELASGAVVGRAVEQVDPARCRLWSEHNRDYAKLDETRCADLIESFKAQGRQEVPAIVRRVRGVPDIDFEVICGARRHWTVTWLRAHNYTEFRFLVEVRELTDEEAFRISDLENRAREDLSDMERAKDYLRALDRHYSGRQKDMAGRINKSEAWLSRYLDLARLPEDLVAAFDDPHELKIKHVTQLKPLLKPDDRERRVLAEAIAIAKGRGEGPPSSPRTSSVAWRRRPTPPRGQDPPRSQARRRPRSSRRRPVSRCFASSPRARRRSTSPSSCRRGGAGRTPNAHSRICSPGSGSTPPARNQPSSGYRKKVTGYI